MKLTRPKGSVVKTFFSWNRGNIVRSRQAVSLGVMVFFCLQLSRPYLVLQPDPELCLRHDSADHETGSHSHPGDSGVLPEQPDNGFYFQHCKETVDGVSLTPSQPLASPVEGWHYGLEASSAVVVAPSFSPRQNHPSIPFHPPRQ